MGSPAPAQVGELVVAKIRSQALPVARYMLILLWKLICALSWLLLKLLKEVACILEVPISKLGNAALEALARRALCNDLAETSSPATTSSTGEKADACTEDKPEGEKVKECEADVAAVFEASEKDEPATAAQTSPEEVVQPEEDLDEDPNEDDEDLVLQRMRLSMPLSKGAAAPEFDESSDTMQDEESGAAVLRRAVWQVRAAGHSRVRFSVQVENAPACVAVLGTAGSVRRACDALAKHAPLETVRSFDHLFLVNFTMRESWDLPQDDELADASLGSEWIDLGTEFSVGDSSESPSQSSSGPHLEGCSGKSKPEDDWDEHQDVQTPHSVLRKRLREVLPDREDLHIFMDDNPFSSRGSGSVRVDLAGLLPDAWDAAAQAVLACEARGVYLSRRYDVLFWCPQQLRSALEDQVASALSHCQGESASHGSGFGLVGACFTGFEDLATNVSAVLEGRAPLGWHRLEWTTHGAGAVPHLTY